MAIPSRNRLILIGALLCASGTAHGHHSFGTFDLNRNIEIVGTIAGSTS